MIDRSTNIKTALRSRQRGFLLNPFRFGAGSGVLFDPATQGPGVTLSAGNTRASVADIGNARGSSGFSSGVWQFECRLLANTNTYAMFGIGNSSTANTSYPGGHTTSLGWWNRNGNIYRNNVATAYSGGYNTGSILGCVVDATAGTVAFYIDGSTAGFVSIGFSGTIFPMFGNGNGAAIPSTDLVYEFLTTLVYPVSGATQWPYA